MNATIKIVQEKNIAIYKDKKSRFIGIVLPVFSEKEAHQEWFEIKKTYHDADHFPYAYILGLNKEILFSSDDGEPSGTGGKPILHELLAFDVTFTMLVVVRYFGGIKLGTSGLKNAFKTTAHQTLLGATIVTKKPAKKLILDVVYEKQHMVFSYANKFHLPIEQLMQSNTNVQLGLLVPLNLVDQTFNYLSKLGNCHTDDFVYFL